METADILTLVQTNDIHNHWIDKLALLNAVLSGLALYPQLYVLFVTDIERESISIVSFALILSNSLIWLWYGVHRSTLPLIISSALNAIAAGAILALLA